MGSIVRRSVRRRPHSGGFPLAVALTWPGTVPRPSAPQGPRCRLRDGLGPAYPGASRATVDQRGSHPPRRPRSRLSQRERPRPDRPSARVGHFRRQPRQPPLYLLLLSVIPEPCYSVGRRRCRRLFLRKPDKGLRLRPHPERRAHRAPAGRSWVSAHRLADLLEEGWSLVIYPEGGRSPDGWAQPHRAGAGRPAARTGRPVVPIHIEGTRVVLPRHGTRLRPGRTHVSFGRPLRAGPGDARSLAERIENSIVALADERTSDWWTATRRAAARSTPALTGPDAASPWRRTWASGDGLGGSPAPRWPKD